MTWSQMSVAQKVFTVVACVLTIVGVEFGLLKDWSTAPVFEHVAYFVITGLIVWFLAYVGVQIWKKSRT